MTDRPKRPRRTLTRRQKLLRDALLLPFLLAVLLIVLDFPSLSLELTRQATERRHLFGPGEVILSVPASDLFADGEGRFDRYYVVRWGDWYALEAVHRPGLSWEPGVLWAVEDNDPSRLLIPLHSGSNLTAQEELDVLAIICKDPEITEVEILYPVGASNARGFSLVCARLTGQENGCFLFPCTFRYVPPADSVLCRGYAADGTLLYSSPVPDCWESRYGLSLGVTPIPFEELYD